MARCVFSETGVVCARLEGGLVAAAKIACGGGFLVVFWVLFLW